MLHVLVKDAFGNFNPKNPYLVEDDSQSKSRLRKLLSRVPFPSMYTQFLRDSANIYFLFVLGHCEQLESY